MRTKIVGVVARVSKENVHGVAQMECAARLVSKINPMDVMVHLGESKGMNVFRSQAVFFSLLRF